MSAPYTVFCAILGDDDLFPVTINGDQSVGELKKQIKVEKSLKLASFEASTLTLYKVEISLNENDYGPLMEAISQSSVGVEEDQKLRFPFTPLSTIPDGFPKDVLHILVKCG